MFLPFVGRKKHKQRNGDNTFSFSSFPSTFSRAPSVAVVDVEHHDCNVLVVVVVLLRLVHELCLHLDDAVKGLVGDQSLVSDVQLEEGCWPASGFRSSSLCVQILAM